MKRAWLGGAVVAAAVLAQPAVAAAEDDSKLLFAGLEVATASAPSDTILYDGGFAFGYYSRLFDTSLSLGGASAPLVTGDRSAFNFVPAAGYHVGWNDRQEGIFQLYGSARLPMQRRSGAGLRSETGYGLAVEGGVRVWGCSRKELPGWCAGFSIATRYQHHMTAFQMGPAVLPAGSAVWTFPVSFALAINPEIR
jgi:hypothetical protein